MSICIKENQWKMWEIEKKMEYRSNLKAVCTENSHERNCKSDRKKLKQKPRYKKSSWTFFVGLVIHGDCWTSHLLVCWLVSFCMEIYEFHLVWSAIIRFSNFFTFTVFTFLKVNILPVTQYNFYTGCFIKLDININNNKLVA